MPHLDAWGGRGLGWGDEMAQSVRFERAGLPTGRYRPHNQGRVRTLSCRHPDEARHAMRLPPLWACPLRVSRAHLPSRPSRPPGLPAPNSTADGKT